MSSSLLNQIENNEVTTLHLTKMPRETFVDGSGSITAKTDHFVEVLSNNTSIVSVVMRGDFLACLRGDQRSKVVQALGKLPQIHTVVLGESLLVISDLTTVLTTASTLKVFTLHDVCLQGPPDLFDEFEYVVTRHGALKEFDLKDCMTANQTIDLNKILETTKKSSVTGDAEGLIVDPACATAGTA
jgi:hypothetical protein